MTATHPSEAINTATSRASRQASVWLVAGLMLLHLVLILWGIRGDLALTPEVDETIFVTSAMHIAATGDFNPHWFGHPGSTMIYPLAALYNIWNAITNNGRLVPPDPSLQQLFDTQPANFYMIGRLLTTIYAVLSVPLVYLIGRRVFGHTIGVLGAAFYVLNPLVIAHAQVVRTDCAAVFFTLLSVLLCLRVYEQPSPGNQVAAGAAIGLGIATRYFMAGLIPLLMAVDLLILRRNRSPQLPRGMVLGMLVIPIVFSLTTPFFVLDIPAARASLRLEARNNQVGADGLTPLGNLLWYLSSAIPDALTWPIAICSLVGSIWLLGRREPRSLLLVGFTLLFLIEISLHGLHWQRWTIQVLPLLGLFAAYCPYEGIRLLAQRSAARPAFSRWLVIVGIVLLAIWPTSRIVLADIRLSNPSTRMIAREWIVQNIAPGSRLAQEWYAAPLNADDFVEYAVERKSAPSQEQPFELYERFSLAVGRTLDDYQREGYRYLVTSSDLYAPILAANQEHPPQYQQDADFYRSLFSSGRLLQEFQPSSTRGGPTIRIYELPQ